MSNIKRNHQKIVLDCYLELKNDVTGERLMTIMNKYGKKTRDEAIQMLKEEAAALLGMTLEEYEVFFREDD